MAAAESWQAPRTLGYPWASQVTRTADNDRPVPESRGLVVATLPLANRETTGQRAVDSFVGKSWPNPG